MPKAAKKAKENDPLEAVLNDISLPETLTMLPDGRTVVKGYDYKPDDFYFRQHDQGRYL